MKSIKDICNKLYKGFQEKTDLYFRVTSENTRRDLLLGSLKAISWKISGDVITIYKRSYTTSWKIASEMMVHDLEKHISKESLAMFDIVKQYGNATGFNKLRIYANFANGENDWHWYELRFFSSEENVSNRELIGIALTVDKKVQEENQLEQWQAEINTSEVNQSYLCNISHDIRTPLNAVTGFSQLITCDDLESTPEELEEYNACIRGNSDMMLAMIDSVTGKSHMKPDELSLRPMQISANSFIDKVYSTHLVLVPSHLKFSKVTDDKDRQVNIDPTLTRQVLNNFLSNAFKFTQQGGITIGWRYLPEEGKAMFFCTDTGVGISKENLENLWVRYYKVSEKDVGTGLGLQISKNIIEQQNGEIGVESTIGHGTTFWFKFAVE